MFRRLAFVFLGVFTQTVFAATPAWNVPEVDLGIQTPDQKWSFPLTSQITNPSAATVAFEARLLPEWMKLDTTGTLSGTPDARHAGSYEMQLTLVSGQSRKTVRARGMVVGRRRPPRWAKPEITLPDARQGFAFRQQLGSFLDNPGNEVASFEIVSNTPPTWLALTESTGELFGQPPFSAQGSVKLRIKVSAVLEGNTYEDTALFRFAISATNRPPVWSQDPLVLPGAIVGTDYRQELAGAVSDPDGDSLTFARLSGPIWMKLDPTTGAFEGTPPAGVTGQQQWELAVTDKAGAQAKTRVWVRVATRNSPPQFQGASLALANAREDDPYQQDLARFVTDADRDPLTFQALDIPDWLQLGAGGGLLGVPTREDVGPVRMRVRVADGKGGSDTAEFTFFVDPTNHAPAWALPTLLVNGVEGTPLRVDLAPYATDPDGDPISFGTVQTSGWGTLGSDGVFTGTPDASQTGRSRFVFRAADSHGAGANLELIVDVKAINHVPRWNAGTLPPATEGSAYQTSVAQFAVDPDPKETLTFEKIGNKPSWLTVHSTGSISGTPGRMDTGSAALRVRVVDSNKQIAETQFAITVQATNHPPRWRQSPLLLPDAWVGADYRFDLALYAAEDDGEALKFEIVQAPKWLKLSADGKLSGRPEAGDTGAFTTVLRVRDGSATWADVSAGGTVFKPNRVPVVQKDWPVFQVKERETLTGNLLDPAYIQDPDGDKLTFLLKQQVSWITLSEDGRFTATPTRAERGKHAFAFSIDDNRGSVLGALRIEVIAQPRPPVWTVNPIQRLALTHQPFSGSVAAHAFDEDGAALRFAKKSGPGWLMVEADGTLSGTPTQVGTDTFELTVCNQDKLCAETKLVFTIHKGLNSQMVRLGDSVAGAHVDVVWMLDESAASDSVVKPLRANSALVSQLFKAQGVGFGETSLGTAGAQTTPERVQSPLWTLYRHFALAQAQVPIPSELKAGGLTEVLLVTRVRDTLSYFTDSRPNHKGKGPATYFGYVKALFPKHQRSWRLSAIAPACPALSRPSCAPQPLPEASYRDWVKETGGFYFDNGCKLQTQQWLKDWAGAAAFWANLTAKKKLQLTQTPASQEDIEVSVGGTVLRQQDGAWYYDAATNSIRLDWSRIDKRALKPHDVLEVKYLSGEG